MNISSAEEELQFLSICVLISISNKKVLYIDFSNLADTKKLALSAFGLVNPSERTG